MGDPKAFGSGHEFAAWLVQKPVRTGGKTVLLGISKRCDTYLRTSLIHGAGCVLSHSKEPRAWIDQLASSAVGCESLPPAVSDR
jgi:transposase